MYNMYIFSYFKLSRNLHIYHQINFNILIISNCVQKLTINLKYRDHKIALDCSSFKKIILLKMLREGGRSLSLSRSFLCFFSCRGTRLSLSLSRSFFCFFVFFSCRGTNPLPLFGYSLSLCCLQGSLSSMDHATAGELLHFHLTTNEDDESSTLVMRSDILEEHVQAFKSTPRSAWKMGLDLRYIDRGIKISVLFQI